MVGVPDLTRDPLGTGSDGQPVYLRDIWPSPAEIGEVIASCLQPEMFTREYAEVFAGDERWRSLPTPAGDTFAWDPSSTYVRRPPYFQDMLPEPGPLRDIEGARVLRCSATRSPPTTSPRPARSKQTPPRAATCASTGCSPATSTPTGRAAATTK